MLLPSALLVIACVLVGMLPEQTVGPLLAMAVHAILGDDTPSYELGALARPDAPLLMSLVALGGGVAFYLVLYFRGRAMVRTPAPVPPGRAAHLRHRQRRGHPGRRPADARCSSPGACRRSSS